jgi:hypothetical protein
MAVEDGDKKVWDHAIESGRLSLIDDEDLRNVALMACYTAEVVDKREGLPEEEMDALLRWATDARINHAMLENVLSGHAFIRMTPTGTPSFSLTPKGIESARQTAEKMGLPPLG